MSKASGGVRGASIWRSHLADTDRKLAWRQQARSRMVDQIRTGTRVEASRRTLGEIDDEIAELVKTQRYQQGQVRRAEK